MVNNMEQALPRPLVHYDNKGFWDGIRKHKLLLQKCKRCGMLLHPPRPMCPECHSIEKDWIPVTGKGHIYSWITYHQTPNNAFKAPYSVVLVELEEGVRIISNMIDCTPQEISVGMPVEVVFDDIASDLTLPKFRKAK